MKDSNRLRFYQRYLFLLFFFEQFQQTKKEFVLRNSFSRNSIKLVNKIHLLWLTVNRKICSHTKFNTKRILDPNAYWNEIEYKCSTFHLVFVFFVIVQNLECTDKNGNVYVWYTIHIELLSNNFVTLCLLVISVMTCELKEKELECEELKKHTYQHLCLSRCNFV